MSLLPSEMKTTLSGDYGVILESASFEYGESWIEHKERFALEPALALTAGSFHTDHNIFGSVGDSTPDRWGRILMRRAESNHFR